MNNNQDLQDGRFSDWVTNLAWTFIGISGFFAFGSGLQIAMLHLFFPTDSFQTGDFIVPADPGLHLTLLVFAMNNLRTIVVIQFGVFVATFFLSIGLLRRSKMARSGFLIILVFWIFVFSAMLIGGGSMYFSPIITKNLPIGFLALAGLFTAVFHCALIGLLIWIYRKLNSRAAMREPHSVD